MNLRIKPSKLQNAILDIWILPFMVVSSYLASQVNINTLTDIVCIGVGIAVSAIFTIELIQFVFGAPWSYDRDGRVRAERLVLSDYYKPSLVNIYLTEDKKYLQVQLMLIMDFNDVWHLINSKKRHAGLHDIHLFEGYFPFSGEKQKFYLTRAAARQIRKALVAHVNCGNTCRYAKFYFSFKIPYFGRENLPTEAYFLLSRWDIRENERLLKWTGKNRNEFCEDEYVLVIQPSTLARYQRNLEKFPLDTFLQVPPDVAIPPLTEKEKPLDATVPSEAKDKNKDVYYRNGIFMC